MRNKVDVLSTIIWKFSEVERPLFFQQIPPPEGKLLLRIIQLKLWQWGRVSPKFLKLLGENFKILIYLTRFVNFCVLGRKEVKLIILDAINKILAHIHSLFFFSQWKRSWALLCKNFVNSQLSCTYNSSLQKKL